MAKEIPDMNLKVPEKIIIMLKKINHRLVDYGFDNVKVLNSIAIIELNEISKDYTTEEFLAYIIMRIQELQSKGIVNENARSIGKKKK